MKRKEEKKPDSKFARRFLAIVRYELLWSIRKRKFVGIVVVAFALPTIILILPVISSNISKFPIAKNPNWTVDFNVSTSGFVFFLFAVITAMSSISGEFESGTIVPLLTKPVSRTMILLGKALALFLTLLVTYTIILVYLSIGGIIVYGPQKNLYLVPLLFIGSLISTLTWAAIVLAISTISKSSVIATLGGLGIWLSLTIASEATSSLGSYAMFLNCLPGEGIRGYLSPNILYGYSIATGTNAIASNLVTYFLNPSTIITYVSRNPFQYYSEPLSLVLARSIIVAIGYILFFMFISWFFLRRAEVLE